MVLVTVRLRGGTPGLPEGARIAEMLEYFSDQLVSQGLGDQPLALNKRGRDSFLDVFRYAFLKLSAREEPGQGPCRSLSPSLIGGQRTSQRGESSSRFRRRRGLAITHVLRCPTRWPID